MKKKEKESIHVQNAMLIEYQLTYNKVLELEKLAHSFINILIAILAITVSIGIALAGNSSNVISILLVIVPLVIDFLCIIVLHYIIRCFRLGGYLRFLEEKVNDFCESQISQWESREAEKEQYNIMLIALFLIIYLVLFFIPLFYVLSFQTIYIVSIFIIKFTIAFVLLWGCFRLKNAHYKVYISFKNSK